MDKATEFTQVELHIEDALDRLSINPEVASEVAEAFRRLPGITGLHPQRRALLFRWGSRALGHADDPSLIRVVLQSLLQCAAADRLRQARQAVGLSIRDAGAKLDLNYGSYAHLETGRSYPRGEGLIGRIALVYGFAPNWVRLLARDVYRELLTDHPELAQRISQKQLDEIVANWMNAIDRRWAAPGG